MQFGLYLVDRGVIDEKQFVEALKIQLQETIPLGQLALTEGMITRIQLFELLRVQSDDPEARFGDAAIGRGYLTRHDIVSLLVLQSDRTVPLSQILVRQGILAQMEADAEMAAFRRKRERSDHQRSIACAGVGKSEAGTAASSNIQG